MNLKRLFSKIVKDVFGIVRKTRTRAVVGFKKTAEVGRLRAKKSQKNQKLGSVCFSLCRPYIKTKKFKFRALSRGGRESGLKSSRDGESFYSRSQRNKNGECVYSRSQRNKNGEYVYSRSQRNKNEEYVYPRPQSTNNGEEIYSRSIRLIRRIFSWVKQNEQNAKITLVKNIVYRKPCKLGVWLAASAFFAGGICLPDIINTGGAQPVSRVSPDYPNVSGFGGNTGEFSYFTAELPEREPNVQKDENPQTAEAYAVYIGDRCFGVVPDKDNFQSGLLCLLLESGAEPDVIDVELTQEIVYEKQTYAKNIVDSPYKVMQNLVNSDFEDGLQVEYTKVVSIKKEIEFSAEEFFELASMTELSESSELSELSAAVTGQGTVGVPGEAEFIYHQRYRDDELVSHELAEIIVVKKPLVKDSDVEKNIEKTEKSNEKKLNAALSDARSYTPSAEENPGGFIWTVDGGVVSSSFGYRKGRMHNGVDISAPVGTAVYAAADGFVTSAKHESNGYGKCIKIDHGNGFMTLYAHEDEIFVSEGEFVKAGQVIGTVGRTGNATGPHLHFEIRFNNVPQNPIGYISN